MNKLRQLFVGQRGATAIEYGLLAALIALGTIAGMEGLGANLFDDYDALAKCFDDPSVTNSDC